MEAWQSLAESSFPCRYRKRSIKSEMTAGQRTDVFLPLSPRYSDTLFVAHKMLKFFGLRFLDSSCHGSFVKRQQTDH
jgi:hypothetical protein